MKNAVDKGLRAFEMHGIALSLNGGTQAVGACPFCGKEDHFYVNKTNLLWDCKICGESGNLVKFLEKINEQARMNFGREERLRIAKDRGLPPSAFDYGDFGVRNGKYTLGIKSQDGKILDVRLYEPGSKLMSTAGAKTGLFGLDKLLKAGKEEPVYLCEGEWDTIAVAWLLKAAGKRGVAVGSPGANVFKDEWAGYFMGRRVRVIFDNDEAGRQGERRVLDHLLGKVTNVMFTHWPENMPVGYDVRDLIMEMGVKKDRPKKAFSILMSFLNSAPRLNTQPASTDEPRNSDVVVQEAMEVEEGVTFQDVVASYETWLHEPNIDSIKTCCIVALAPLFEVPQPWIFLVAPPSSGKTAVINAFQYLQYPHNDMAVYVDSITEHSLVSGMNVKGGDPSLLPKLQNPDKALFIKDFSPILSMRENEKQDIYSQFRSAHDGYASKQFGNGVFRRYSELKFSVCAGVTEQIYNEAAVFQALGERFCKLQVGRDNDYDFELETIDSALEVCLEKAALSKKTYRKVYSYINIMKARASKENFRLPALSRELRLAIAHISMYVSKMRGTVSRDRYKREHILSAPKSEMGTRFATMLGGMASIQAFMAARNEANLDDLPLLRKIALDTVNQRDEEILRIVYKLSQEGSKIPPLEFYIQQACRYTRYTVSAVLEDMVMLKILDKEKVGHKAYYRLSRNMQKIISCANLYSTEQELNRKTFKVHLNRSKTGEGVR